MEKKIVALLRRQDKVEDMLPYLEDLARPGVKVVFLVPYPVEPSFYLRDYWITTESRTKAMSAAKDLVACYSWEMQRGLAEKRVSAALERLQDLGADVSVDLWVGSLKTLTESYLPAGQVSLIMRFAKVALPGNFLRRTRRFFRQVAQADLAPVLLFHSNRTA